MDIWPIHFTGVRLLANIDEDSGGRLLAGWLLRRPELTGGTSPAPDSGRHRELRMARLMLQADDWLELPGTGELFGSLAPTGIAATLTLAAAAFCRGCFSSRHLPYTYG